MDFPIVDTTPRPIYEYRVIYVGSFDDAQMSEALSNLGTEGWRLVPVHVGHSASRLVMEREVVTQ